MRESESEWRIEWWIVRSNCRPIIDGDTSFRLSSPSFRAMGVSEKKSHTTYSSTSSLSPCVIVLTATALSHYYLHFSTKWYKTDSHSNDLGAKLTLTRSLSQSVVDCRAGIEQNNITVRHVCSFFDALQLCCKRLWHGCRLSVCHLSVCHGCIVAKHWIAGETCYTPN